MGRCVFNQYEIKTKGTLSPFDWHHKFIQNNEELEKDMAIVFDAARKLNRTKEHKYAFIFYGNKNLTKIKELVLKAVRCVVKPLWGFLFSRWMYFEGCVNCLWFVRPWLANINDEVSWQLPEYYVYPSQIDVIRTKFFESVNIESFYMRHPIFPSITFIQSNNKSIPMRDNGNKMLSVMVNGYFQLRCICMLCLNANFNKYISKHIVNLSNDCMMRKISSRYFGPKRRNIVAN